MYRFFLIVFLMAASAPIVCGATYGQPLCEFIDSRLEQNCIMRTYGHDAEEASTTVAYTFAPEHSAIPDKGFFEVRSKKGNGVVVTMDYGDDPQKPLQIAICYDEAGLVDQTVVVTSVAPMDKKNGEVDIVALNNTTAPAKWVHPIAEGPASARPSIYGMIYADKDEAHVTRYVFRACHEAEGVFVRVSVQYKNLHQVVLSWGKETYGGYKIPDAQVKRMVANRKPLEFVTHLS